MGCAQSRREVRLLRRKLTAQSLNEISPLHSKNDDLPLTFDNSPLYDTVLKDICVLCPLLTSFLSPADQLAFSQVASWTATPVTSTPATIWPSRSFRQLQLLPYSHHSSLHFPRLSLAMLSCIRHFRHLTSLSLGTYGISDISTTDTDLEELLLFLGSQLHTIAIIKLNSITIASFTTIFRYCQQITSVTFFGCTTAQHEYPSFAAATEKRLKLLDVRYSIEVTDMVLNDIMNAFCSIDM